MSEPIQPNFYAVIPAYVRYCKDIEMGAKLLYGEISSLTHAEGYCWASNNYFADLYGVDNRTIQRWLESLKTHKFIKIERQKNGIHETRKIWISLEVQKMFTARQKCHPPHDKNVIHNNKKEYEKEIYKEKVPRTARASASAITLNHDKRTFEGIGLDDLKAWKEKFPAINVERELGLCYEWALTKKYTNYRKSIITWLRNVQSTNTNPSPQKNKIDDSIPIETRNLNKARAERWEKEFEIRANHHYAIFAKSLQVDFLLPEGKGYSVSYNLTEKEFEEKCNHALKKMRVQF